MVSRSRNVYLAKLAEQAERFDEMTKYMSAVCTSPCSELSVEERNLLSVAYKNASGSRRAAWRVICSIEQKAKANGDNNFTQYAVEYRERIEQELQHICNDILELLDGTLISAAKGESKIFYLKMKADYYRYIAEITSGPESCKASESAHALYGQVADVATLDLGATHPTTLGLALGYSTFQYEVLQNREEACKLAKTAFERALGDLDNIDEGSYKDATLLMQLLRDSLNRWTSEQEVTPSE